MQRKLTAILSADVVGYSGLMEADETGTMERLKANRRAIFDPQVATHGGRVFKLLGDGALVEFPSIVAAVTCALAIQEATEQAGHQLPEAGRIRYRIGINLGDVIIDGEDIYGDGVNVAARLQMLASAGGIALSKTVRDHVEGKTAYIFEDMGEYAVKNIQRPVHVFSVRASHAPDVRKAVERLSICVLPFANMSEDPQQEYFSDGISEDIITDLSKVSALLVISRNSAFSYKGRHVDVPRVARELKVSHVLEGSVRKSGSRVRITAQLIDGVTNGHVWAERYDRDLNDIFALQDEISEAIVNALKLKLLPEEKKAIAARGTDSADAYNLYLMARQYVIEGNQDKRRDEEIARLCERAIAIDPDYAGAWALLAQAQMNERFRLGGKGDGGLAAAERAIALDPSLGEAHAVKVRILSEDGRFDEAAAELAVALRLDPDSWEVNNQAGLFSFRQKRLEDATRYWERATSLAETDFGSPTMLVMCYSALGNVEAMRRAAHITITHAEKAIALDRSNGTPLANGAYALAALGEAKRAKDWINRALLVDPDNFSMRYNFACALANHLKDPNAALDMLATILNKAGRGFTNHAKTDPDFAPLQDHPRFKAMMAEAEARLATENSQAPS